jgi:hypothetical protein
MDISVIEGLTFSMTVATAVLAIVTHRMASATSDMADATKKSISLEAEPQLALAELRVDFDDSRDTASLAADSVWTQFVLVLSNPGKVLIQYRVEEIAITFDKIETKSDGEFRNRGGVIHPGASTLFRHPRYSISKSAQQPLTTRIRYRIRYWAVAGEERETRGAIEAYVYLPPKQAAPWVFSDGPTYGR